MVFREFLDDAFDLVYACKRRLKGGSVSYKSGNIIQGDETIYTKNTIGRYLQATIRREDFLDEVDKWLQTLDDERMCLLRRFVFEVDLAATEELKDVLYQYGGLLTEKNYCGRKFFERMATLVRQLEINRQLASGL